MTEQRQLSKAIANGVRLSYLKALHQKWRNDTRRLQDELDDVRKKDAANLLWPLAHWQEYPIAWKRIAKEHVCPINAVRICADLRLAQMQGRSGDECRHFWSGHSCIDNPSINRSKTWSKAETKSLKEAVESHEERDWSAIAKQHKCRRTPLQCAQRWMQKVKPRDKVELSPIMLQVFLCL